MPKIYLTAAQRKADMEKKEFLRQDYDLTHILHNHSRDNRITIGELAERSGFAYGTVQKALKTPDKLRVETLRRIFSAAGLELYIGCKQKERLRERTLPTGAQTK